MAQHLAAAETARTAAALPAEIPQCPDLCADGGIYALMAAAAVTAILGHWVDSGVIAGVVVINALFGFIREGKAEKALDAIRQLLSFNAQALRDGRRREIPATALTPGDIVFLASGDKVPADLRLKRAACASANRTPWTRAWTRRPPTRRSAIASPWSIPASW